MRNYIPNYIPILLILLGLPNSVFAGWSQKVMSNDSVDIVVSTIYDLEPGLGILPLEVEVANKSASDASWKLISECNSHGSTSGKGSFEHEMPVPAASKKNFQIVINNYLNTKNSGYCNIRLSGPGVSGFSSVHIPREETYNKAYTPRTLIGTELRDFHVALELDFGRSKDAFENQAGRNKNDVSKRRQAGAFERRQAGAFDFSGALVSKKSLPHDWRAYLPAKQVWLSKNEYDSIKKAQKNALDSWVMQGGDLFLVTRLPVAGQPEVVDTESSYRAPDYSDETPFGLGSVIELSPDSFDSMVSDYRFYLTPSLYEDPAIFKAIDFRSSTASSKVPWAEFLNFDDTWIKSLSTVVLIVYTALIFIFCLLQMSKRSLLGTFFKLAGLSTLVSFGIVTIVMFGDGFGVAGERNLAVVLDSKNNREVVFQEQGLRTGTVLNRDISLGSDTLLRVAAVVSEEQEDRHRRRYNSEQFNFSSKFDGENYVLLGDFLKDRTYSQQFLQKVSKTRSELSITRNGGELFVSSSLPVVLENFYFRDHVENLWTASKIVPGERAQLRLAESNFELGKFSASVEQIKNRVKDRKNHFFATTKYGQHYAIPWYKGTDWKATETFMTGPVQVKG